MKKIIKTSSIIALLFIFSSCAKKINFQNSAITPAARGTVKVKKDNNNNYAIKIEIFNLAEVNRLEPPKKTYVVWMESNETSVKNIGKIDSDNSLLSKKLKATFQSVSSSKPTKIFITAENDGSATYPDYAIILSTNNF